MIFTKLPIYALAAIFMATPTLGFASEEEEEGDLEEGELFFELNDTDGDLGIHGFADGDAWKELEIEGPYERELLEINVKSRLKRQGLTELFFESAEPCFPTNDECDPDEALDPKVFFKRFPQGWYEIEVETLEGDELAKEIFLSHVLPAAPGPDGTTVNGGDAAESCDEDLEVVDPSGGVIITWDPVTQSHRRKNGPVDGLGRKGPADISDRIRNYEVVVEIDESDFNMKAIVPADTNSWTFPADFFVLAEEGETEEGVECDGPVNGDACYAEYKYEILVRVNTKDENPGNKSAMESCFLVEIE